jgi:diguanylate cyclase (GGDEF)-like protein
VDFADVTTVIGACVAVLVLVVVLLFVRGRRARSDDRFEAVLVQLDRHMGEISESLERVVERSAAARAKGVDDLELTVDLGELLRRIAIEAATRTRAEAAAVHVEGPGGAPMAGSFGADDRAQPLESPLAHAAGAFRAVTINWTYRPGVEGESDPFASALVVPIVEAGVETGTLAAYAPEAGAFGAEHIRALEALAEEAGPAIASARRFAEAQRAMTDALTGLRNRKGYEVELERAITRAQETGQPLSLLILNRDDPEGAADDTRDLRTDLALQELAGLLVELTRTTDVVCLREDGEFGIVLPETAGDAARRFYVRLRDEASRKTFPITRQLTFTAGVVEWRPDESSEAFDARALAAVGTNRVDVLELAAPKVGLEHKTAVPATRQDFEERLGHEIVRARSLDRPLAVLLMNVDGLAHVDERRDRAAVERALAELATRLDSKLDSGDASCHIGEEEFALILGGATADKAEVVLAALQASLEKDPPREFEWLGLSAGITELAWADDVASVFGRAEHALWRAKRAGTGTIVVAMAADDSRR